MLKFKNFHFIFTIATLLTTIAFAYYFFIFGIIKNNSLLLFFGAISMLIGFTFFYYSIKKKEQNFSIKNKNIIVPIYLNDKSYKIKINILKDTNCSYAQKFFINYFQSILKDKSKITINKTLIILNSSNQNVTLKCHQNYLYIQGKNIQIPPNKLILQLLEQFY